MLIAYLDFAWALMALVYDAPKLSQISWFLWPLVLICPLFPFLLGLVWLKVTNGKEVNQFLICFAAIPSAVFGVLALLFYPMLMINEGFSLLGMGQIFWVLFYGVQGWYLIARYKIKPPAVIAVNVYLIVKTTLDYYFLSFGYLSVDKLTHNQLMVLYVGGLVAILVVNVFIRGRRTTDL